MKPVFGRRSIGETLVNETHNPYQAPTANLDAADRPLKIEPVGNWKRFGTYLIDQLGIYAMMFIVAFLIGYFFGQAGIQALLGVNQLLLGAMFFLSYYLVFEGLWARTPAKLILGTRVVTEEGDPPSFRTILIRSLCRMIPFEPFSFFGERSWHDGISKTFVISTRG